MRLSLVANHEELEATLLPDIASSKSAENNIEHSKRLVSSALELLVRGRSTLLISERDGTGYLLARLVATASIPAILT